LYTDTDSLIYKIETDDFYRDIAGDVETWFHTSEFDAGHPSGYIVSEVIFLGYYSS